MDLVIFSLIGTLQHFQTIQQEREERYCQCYLGVSCKNLHQVSGLSQITLAYSCPLLTTHSVEGRVAVRAKAPFYCSQLNFLTSASLNQGGRFRWRSWSIIWFGFFTKDKIVILAFVINILTTTLVGMSMEYRVLLWTWMINQHQSNGCCKLEVTIKDFWDFESSWK